MSNPYVRVLDHVETVHGQRVAIGVDYDSVTVDGLQFGPEVRDKFARVYFQADTEAKAYTAANPPEPVCVRPCCDHCNNGEGDRPATTTPSTARMTARAGSAPASGRGASTTREPADGE